MAETPTTSSSTSSDQTPELSKEDLIKQVKKQRVLLQKLKQKCDELNERCAKQDKQLAIKHEQSLAYEEQGEILERLKTENEGLKTCIKELEEKNKGLSQHQRNVSEKLECMQMKEGSLMSALQHLELDLKKISSENKELQNSNANLKSELDDWKSSVENALALKTENESLRSALSAVETEHDDCKQKLERFVNEHETLIRENAVAKAMHESRNEEFERKEKALEETLARKEAEASGLNEATKEIQILKQKLEQAETEKCTLQKNFEETLSQCEELKEQLSIKETCTDDDQNATDDDAFQEGDKHSTEKIDDGSEVERMCEQVHLLKAELQNVMAERDQLLFQESREQQDCSHLQDFICRLETEVEEFRTKLESSEFETNELRAKLEEAELELVNNRARRSGTALASAQSVESWTGFEEVQCNNVDGERHETGFDASDAFDRLSELRNELQKTLMEKDALEFTLKDLKERRVPTQQLDTLASLMKYNEGCYCNAVLKVNAIVNDVDVDDRVETWLHKVCLSLERLMEESTGNAHDAKSKENAEDVHCFDALAYLMTYNDGRYGDVISKISAILDDVDDNVSIEMWLGKVHHWLERLKNENVQNVDEVRKKENELEEKRLEAFKAEEELERLANEKCDLGNEAENLKQLVCKAENATEELRRALNVKDAEIDALRRAEKKLSGESISLSKYKGGQCSEVASKIAALMPDIDIDDAIEDWLGKVHTHLERLKEHYDRAVSETKMKEMELNDARSELIEMNDALQSLATEHQAAGKDVEGSKRVVEEVGRELDELKELLNVKEHEIIELRDEIKEKDDKERMDENLVAQSRRELEKGNDELKMLKAKLETLKAEQEEKADLERRIQTTEDSLSEKVKELNAATLEKESLMQDAFMSDNKMRKLEMLAESAWEELLAGPWHDGAGELKIEESEDDKLLSMMGRLVEGLRVVKKSGLRRIENEEMAKIGEVAERSCEQLEELEAEREQLQPSEKVKELEKVTLENESPMQGAFTSANRMRKLEILAESAWEELLSGPWHDGAGEIKIEESEDDKLLSMMGRLVEGLRVIKKSGLRRIEQDEMAKNAEVAERSREQLDELEAEHERLRNELRTNVERVAELEIASETKVKEIEMLQSKLEQFMAEKEKLEKSVIDAESEEVQTLKDKVQLLESKASEMSSELQKSAECCATTKQDLDKIFLELATVRSKYADLQAENDQLEAEMSGLRLQKQKLESSIVELSGKLNRTSNDLEKERSKCAERASQLQQSTDKVSSLEKELQDEKESHGSTRSQVDQLQQEVKRHGLENLEFADYERVVVDLNAQLSSKTEAMEKLEKDGEQQEEVAAGLRKQLEQLEEQLEEAENRGKKMKSLLVKTKKEFAEAKQREALLQSQSTKLHVEIEMHKQAEETLKVENADLLCQNQKLQELIRHAKESHQRSVVAFEGQINTLRNQLAIVEAECKQSQADYENYKVRVHSVLKQQKCKQSQPTTPILNETEKECIEKVVEQLRAKLQEVNDQLLVSNMENRTMQEEHERALERYKTSLKEAQLKQAALKEQVDQLTEEQEAKEAEHRETVESLQRQLEMLKSTYTEKVLNLQSEHSVSSEQGQRRVAKLEAELARLQQEQQKHSPVRELEIFDVTNVERQEGEGSENTEPVYHKPHLESLTPVVSLEQLLNSDTKSVSSQASLSLQDIEGIEGQLTASKKKLQHLTEVLNESEASNIRLTEQTRLLKDEIRRLERNQERQQHAENLEYLKNVVLKFLTLTSGEERERLVPVLTMMLRLSPEERNQLGSFAVGVGDKPDGEAAAASSWGSYLPRWSGLV